MIFWVIIVYKSEVVINVQLTVALRQMQTSNGETHVLLWKDHDNVFDVKHS